MTSSADHARGTLLVVAAGLSWSTGGVLMRMVEEAPPATVAFWRAATMGLAVLAALLVRHRGRLVEPFRAAGLLGPVAGFFIAGASTCFILALGETTVSNVLFLQCVGPFVAAILGWVLLGERVRPATWAAIAIAACGVAIMVRDGLVHSGLAGNLLALMIGVFLAFYTVALRFGRAVDMMPVLVYMGVFGAGACALMAPGIAVSAHDFAICTALGAGQLALGNALYVVGSRHVPAAEIILLTLLEVVLGPVWVFLAIGEVPTAASLGGGAVVVAAVLVQAFAARRGNVPQAVEAGKAA